MSKSKLEKNFEDIFDLPEQEPLATEVVKKEVKTDTQEEDIVNDHKYARENLYGIIENGSNALSTLTELAQASEHPRAYEVMGQLMKTLTDANKDLLELHRKTKLLKQDNATPKNVTNALFVGNTNELQKLMKNSGGS